MIGLIICILGSLLAAIYLRKRGNGAFFSIALGGVVRSTSDRVHDLDLSG